MQDLTKDFGELVRRTEVADLVKGQGYSLHDTQGTLILCERDVKNYYLTTTILITAKELEGYKLASGIKPTQFLFDIIQDICFQGDPDDHLNKERFDKERSLFSIEKKKVKTSFFGVGDNMFNSANLQFQHQEFYYQIIIKKQKKIIGKKKKHNSKPKAAN